MNRFARTVLGPLPVCELGRTMMHEHVLCDLRTGNDRNVPSDPCAITMRNRFEIDYFQNRCPTNMILDQDAVAVEELRAFREAGGGALLELTVGGMSPQPLRLAEISRRSGVPIVLGAGFYTETYLDHDVRGASEDELCETIVGQIEDGAWGTDVRCGIIGEIGCSWPLTDCERRVLRAAARAHRRTGAAITIHPGRHPDAPEEIVDVLIAAGADPSRVIVGHMDRTIFDRPRLMRLLELEVVLEWDFFGIETSQYWMNGVDLDLPTDTARLDLIAVAFDADRGDQIVVSHDICTRTRLLHYGGHGYGHFISHVLPLALRRGFLADDLERILVRTPARLLGFVPDAEAAR